MKLQDDRNKYYKVEKAGRFVAIYVPKVDLIESLQDLAAYSRLEDRLRGACADAAADVLIDFLEGNLKGGA